MRYTKIKSKQFYIMNLLVLFILFLRQIVSIGVLENYGNMILGPLIFIGFLFLGRKSSYEISKIGLVLIYLIISLATSLFLGHLDYLKIFSEVLSIYLFLVIIPGLKAKEWEIERIFKAICVFVIVLIIMKTLGDFNIISNSKYTFINKNSWAQALMFPFFIS